MLVCDPKKPTHVLNLPQMQSEANVKSRYMQTKPSPSITPKITRFKLMCLNIDSVSGHTDQLRILLDQEKPHIMCLNETKLDLSISDSLVNVDNYQIIRNDRDRHSGGAAVYVHESISYKIRSDLMPDNLELVTLQIANSKFKLTSIYRPLGKPVSYFNDMEALLASLDSDNKEAIIMGDTNRDFLDSSNNDTKNLKHVLSLHKPHTNDKRTYSDHWNQ